MSGSKGTGWQDTAVAHALAYWIAHWDWESPTLFGISEEEFTLIAAAWSTGRQPLSGADAHWIAAIGALRELLYGACAIPALRVPEVLGIESPRAEALLERLESVRGGAV